MGELFLPVMSFFANKNIWNGSISALRYKICPVEQKLVAEVWRGPWCYELSKVEATTEVPMQDEGIEELRIWLSEWSKEINGRPPISYEESFAMRDAVINEKKRQA